MAYGVLEYDEQGRVKCEICGLYFDRVVSHVRQKHQMSEKEYKTTYGFDTSYGICSQRSKELSRFRTLNNYEKCIQQNLIRGGEKTRFVNGSAGRPNVSEQTRIRLSKQYLLPTVSGNLKGRKKRNDE